MNKTKRFTISECPVEFFEAFENFSCAMNLTRSQAFIFLMCNRAIATGDIKTVVPDNDARNEWRELLLSQFFEFAKL